MKLTSPSPAPSEPCFSLKSTTSQATQEPPKPPRDPSRVSSLDIRRNLPTTFAMKNVAGSTTSLPAFVHSRTLTNSITPKDTEFIWKAPPAPFVSQSNLYENPSAVPYSNSRRTAISQAPTDEVLEKWISKNFKRKAKEKIVRSPFNLTNFWPWEWFTKYWNDSQNIGKIHKILEWFTKYWKNSQNIGKIHKISEKFTKYWKHSQYVLAHGHALKAF